MNIVCLDFEGVIIPEIWIAVAEKLGIDDLRLTTRDISDYDKLMQHRIKILAEHGISLQYIQNVIAEMRPMEGACRFLDKLREDYQVFILSDTFYDFARPFMELLKHPSMLCHELVVDSDDMICGYRLRQNDAKRAVVRSLKELKYHVIASGDSYNDTNMLAEADSGILFRPPANVVDEFPQFPHVEQYDDLLREIDLAQKRHPGFRD